MNKYSLPQNLEVRIKETIVPFYALKNLTIEQVNFANTLNWYIHALAPLPIVKGVFDEYIPSCATIAKNLSNVKEIDNAEFIRVFENEMREVGFDMETKDLTEFYNYFLEDAKNGFE